MPRCTRKRNAWMMETAMGILARRPEEGRSFDREAALSSGVVEDIEVLDALQWVSRHIKILNLLWNRLQACGVG